MKVSKNGELIGPKANSIFKASLNFEKDGTLAYIIEVLKSRDIWAISLSPVDLGRIIDALATNNQRLSKHESSESPAKAMREELLQTLRRLDELKREVEGTDQADL